MPLVLHEQLEPAGEIGLWQITEGEDWFRDQLLLYPAELRQLSTLQGHGRRLEWLAARQLVHVMSGRDVRGAFIKDEYGKPHLEHADWHISISHTTNLSGAIAAPEACGIDVQVFVPKITRLARKFVNPAEAAWLDPATQLEQLHLIWGAKEALYKAYGRREIDWMNHLIVDRPVFDPAGGHTSGWVVKNGHRHRFEITYRLFAEAHILVYAREERGVEHDAGTTDDTNRTDVH